jgi:hypothetical protein
MKRIKTTTVFVLLLQTLIGYTQGPGGVTANLELWLKADIGPDCTTNGCGITFWADQSGLNQHCWGPGTATYLTNYTNYRPAMNFTNDPQPMLGTMARTVGNNGFTKFATGNLTTVSDECFMETGDGIGRSYFIDRRFSTVNISYALTTGMPRTFTASDPGGFGNASVFDNNQLIFITAKDHTSNWTNGWYSLGDDLTGNNQLTGAFGEYIYYDNQLSAANQQLVESYLSIKYGITPVPDNDGDLLNYEAPNANGINEGDILSSASAVIWDASVSTTYHNDIIIIGRDDASALTQLQSHTLDDVTRIYLSTLAATNAANTGSFSADLQFVAVGNNTGQMCAQAATSTEQPGGVFSRLEREWKITNSAFPGTFSADFTLDACANLGSLNASDLRLLVDADGDFTNATVHTAGGGLTFSVTGSVVTVSGISNAQVPVNTTQYLTIASASFNTPLPIELLSFEALLNQDQVDISWATASETDNNYFTVDRSVDGVNFEEVVQVDGAGISNSILNYFEIDYQPISGISYYRLKQTDFDGDATYSNIVPVEYKNTGEPGMSIYPSPGAGNDVFLELNAMPDKEVLVVLRNISGQEVYSKVIFTETGDHIEAIDPQKKLAPGTYLVTASSQNALYSRKLIVK